MSVRSRRFRTILGAAACFVVAFALVLALSYQRLLRWYVIEQARGRGVLIESAVIEGGWGSVRLRDARFALQGVDALSARVDFVEVGLSGGKPVRLAVSGLGLEATGAISVLTSQVIAWSHAHAGTSELPIHIDPVNLTWREQLGAPPLLTVLKAVATPEPSGGRVIAPKVLVAGLELGRVSATWKANQREISIGLGGDDPSTAPVRIQLTRAPPFLAKVSWQPAMLSELAARFGLGSGLPAFNTEGAIEVKFSDLRSPIEGSAHVVVHGFVPPHPVELNGIVFGDRTTVDLKFSVPEAWTGAKLTDVKVVAGAFKLEGAGDVTRVGGHATIGLKLSAALPCSSLARSAAVGRLGKLLGGMVGQLAQGRLAGAITVTVAIEADTRELGAAKVKDSIGGACTLRLL